MSQTVSGIDKVCFVGAGTMGCYNALAAAVCGYSVVLYDPSESSLAAIPQRQREMANMLVGAGWCSEEDVEAAAGRTVVTCDLGEACKGADLVNESVFEDLKLKRQVHAELDAICDAETLLTTNSSALLVSDIEVAVTRCDRFAALHSHYASPLVDIVPGRSTRPELVALLEAYVRSLRGVPLVMKKEHPGYVLNAMLGNVLGTALAMLVGKQFSVPAIDASWLEAQQALMGPFGLIDLFGLGVLRDAWGHRDRMDALQPFKHQIVELLEQKLAAGKLGMHSGEGFYTYPEPAYGSQDFASHADDRCARLLQAALMAQAIRLVAGEVVSVEQVDLAWSVGMHAPRGPFALIAELGKVQVLSQLQESGLQGLLSAKEVTQASSWLTAHVNDNGELN
ncbi:hypothetical protein EY643_12665 [Halioglobus maricola]|uniref:3-hydroxyacyl-CoA dehydrogenase n=1 Tax=Halioglobus maricola TaxID=2601894 RepID=A0A5P9NMF2_9GAMM|nr:3-hydroxyacyl-CoA dehydrogenase NAD-binding domain-containing protein [Halioglobus maricola]QFU76444.1 hypothetical protein EY643_12665 [Halioglobus maricola]